VFGSDFFEVTAGAVESVEVFASLVLEAPIVETQRNQTSIKDSKIANIIKVILLGYLTYLCLWESLVVERRIQPLMRTELPRHP
jgi:hypothetical protein